MLSYLRELEVHFMDAPKIENRERPGSEWYIEY